ncbi:ATP-binding cassette domain-containing protein [Frankia sp. AgKG'84/4]
MLAAGQGRSRIVEDVSFRLEAGTVTGLIGPNGAGKTTLIDALTGFATIFAGSVNLGGADLTGLPAHERQRLGLARTFQALELFDSLEVAENLAVVARTGRGPTAPAARDASPPAAHAAGGGHRRRPPSAPWSRFGPRSRSADPAGAPAAATPEVRRLGLTQIADRLPATLTHDERAAVALGRALVGAPKVLLLDEPAAGLDPADRHELAARVRGAAGRGIAVLLVDHDVQLVLDLCDQVLVLDSGRIVARGRPAQVRADPAVRAAYLGEPDAPSASASALSAAVQRSEAKPLEAQSLEAQSLEAESLEAESLEAASLTAQPRESRPIEVRLRATSPDPSDRSAVPVASAGRGGDLLVFEGVTSGYNEGPVLREVSLAVRAGEIVALLGANGAGKTTLIRTAAGLVPASSGRIALFGEWTRRVRPSVLARRGLAVVPQGRGALGRLTVRENLKLAAGRQHRGEIERVLAWFPPLGPLLDRAAGELSGGERQRLALAVALVRRPRLLLVDELSFGLAPGVAPTLLELLRTIAAETSTGVLLVEQFAAIALRVADRGYVLDRGRIALSATAAELAARPDLLEATYLGAAAPPPGADEPTPPE